MSPGGATTEPNRAVRRPSRALPSNRSIRGLKPPAMLRTPLRGSRQPHRTCSKSVSRRKPDSVRRGTCARPDKARKGRADWYTDPHGYAVPHPCGSVSIRGQPAVPPSTMRCRSWANVRGRALCPAPPGPPRVPFGAPRSVRPRHARSSGRLRWSSPPGM